MSFGVLSRSSVNEKLTQNILDPMAATSDNQDVRDFTNKDSLDQRTNGYSTKPLLDNVLRARRKRTFKIVSIKMTGDSMDNLDAGHTERTDDYSSDILELSCGEETPSASEDMPYLLRISSQDGGTEADLHSRFHVVKIDTKEPFKRGRWTCHVSVSVEKRDTKVSRDDVNSEGSSTCSSKHFQSDVDDIAKSFLQVCSSSISQNYIHLGDQQIVNQKVSKSAHNESVHSFGDIGVSKTATNQSMLDATVNQTVDESQSNCDKDSGDQDNTLMPNSETLSPASVAVVIDIQEDEKSGSSFVAIDNKIEQAMISTSTGDPAKTKKCKYYRINKQGYPSFDYYIDLTREFFNRARKVMTSTAIKDINDWVDLYVYFPTESTISVNDLTQVDVTDVKEENPNCTYIEIFSKEIIAYPRFVLIEFEQHQSYAQLKKHFDKIVFVSMKDTIKTPTTKNMNIADRDKIITEICKLIERFVLQRLKELYKQLGEHLSKDENNSDIIELQEDIRATFKRSIKRHSEFLKEFTDQSIAHLSVDEEVKEKLNKIEGIISYNSVGGRLQIIIGVNNSDNVTAQVKEILTKYPQITFNILYGKKQPLSHYRSGDRVCTDVKKYEESKTHDMICYKDGQSIGTLGGFLKTNEHNLYAVVADHVFQYSTDNKLYISCEDTYVNINTEQNSSGNHSSQVRELLGELSVGNSNVTAPTIDVAVVDVSSSLTNKFDFHFKDSNGERFLKGEVVESVEDKDYYDRLPVYIWGAMTKPGNGKLIINIKDFETSVMVTDINAENFAIHGDSGAMVCDKQLNENKIRLIGILVERIEITNESHGAKLYEYKVIHFKKCLQYLRKKHMSSLELAKFDCKNGSCNCNTVRI